MNRFQSFAARLFNIQPTPVVVEKPVIKTVPAPPQTKTYKAVTQSGQRGAYFSTPSRLIGQLWVSYMTADGELVQDMLTVRSLARYLSKQNEYAARYLDLVSTNVVGSEGIVMQARNVLRNGKLNAKVNAKIEAAWEDWGRACTVDGRMSWLDVQDFVARAVARDGEVFINFITGARSGNKYGIALQVLESDSLDHLKNDAGDPENGRNAIKLGVEVDDYNRPVAYHFYNPNNLGAYSPVIQPTIRVPAANVVHLYRHNASANQTRGISWLHPVLTVMKMFKEYCVAELEAANLVASKVMFFESDGSAQNVFGDQDTGINPGGTAADQFGGPQNSQFNPPRELIEVAPGTPTVLPPGLKVKELTTDHPGTTFGPFSTQMLQGMATGLNVSYASLSGDLSQGNNASTRMGQQIERDYWKKIQSWFINQLCQKVFDRWLAMALLTSLDLPTKTPSDYSVVRWQPRGYSGNDPYKDAKSYADLIASGIKSRTQIITELGGDPDEVFNDLSREESEAKRLGININGADNVPDITAGVQNNPVDQPTDQQAADDAAISDSATPLEEQ